MKSNLKAFLSTVLVVWAILPWSFANADTCTGKFANPITDICWSCMFPMKIGGKTLIAMDQEDTPNPDGTNPVCFCGSPPNAGLKVSFWEAVRRIDVVREPFCMVSLGGIKMDMGFDAPPHGRTTTDAQTKSSFYQAHWYIDPIMFYIQVIMDSNCLENKGFDVAYLTELDPLWNDDELTRFLNPDVYLFGNMIAQAACAVDCATATLGFPNNLFFWCAGCQGSMYPLNGNVSAHHGGVQASSLIASRLIAKMHREMIMWSASGADGMCGYYPQPLMDKTSYKYQMIYPIPQTQKIAGKCCQPLGRSTMLWGAGKEFPYKGEDFAYEIFRKRNCCQGVF